MSDKIAGRAGLGNGLMGQVVRSEIKKEDIFSLSRQIWLVSTNSTSSVGSSTF